MTVVAMESLTDTSAERRPVLVSADVTAASAEGLPADLPTSSYDLLSRAAANHASRTAIIHLPTIDDLDRPDTLTYRGLLEGVTRTANLLHALGVASGDVTALLLPNLPETHLALWGAEAAGIVLPLNFFLEAKAIAALLDAAGAKVVIGFADEAAVLSKLVEAVAGAPSVRHVVLVGSADGAKGAADFGDRMTVHHFSAALATVRGDRLESGREIGAGEVASYFCTGGTTGLPKIAVRTHGQTMANAWMVDRMLGPAMNAQSVMFCGLPLYHVNAVMITGMLPFLNGASVVLGTPLGYRNPDVAPNFWRVIERFRITAFSAVPTLLVSLLDHPNPGFDVSSLRFAICGASPLSAEVLHRFERTFDVSISEGFGMTETSCVASLNPVDGEHRAGSVGLPLPMQEVRIVALDHEERYLRDVEVGEMGVVAVAGPNVFSGYLSAAHNRNAWLDRRDGVRWLNTGDLGRLDADGYLWLTGRAKDLIIRGGHNIDPSVIEEALYAHPDVALVAAIGRPDVRAGEVPVAYVQLREGASADEADLLAFAAKGIAERAAVPKALTIVERLPLTSVGKIHKPTLRHLECLAVARAALAEAGIGGAGCEIVGDGVGGASIRANVPQHSLALARGVLGGFSFAHQVAAAAVDDRPSATRETSR